jgi:hypothetical protein
MEVSDNKDDAATGRVSKTKRALLKAGWTAPVILAVGVPVAGFAAHCSTDHELEPGKSGVSLPKSGGTPGGPRDQHTGG